MKKSIISIILIMLFMLTFASCETDSVDGDTTAGSTDNQGTSEAASGEEDSTDTQTGSENLAFGLIPKTDSEERIKKDESLYVNADTVLSLPVFSDPYPMGHGGAEFVVDDSVKEKLEGSAKRYYELLGYEYEPEAWSLNTDIATLETTVADENYKITVNPAFISFSGYSDEYSVDMSEEEILKLFADEPHIKAMVEFAGITEPVLYMNILKNGSNKIMVAKLYNNADSISDRIINCQLNYVSINISDDSDMFYCHCFFADTQRIVETSTELLTYEAAAASLPEGEVIIGCDVIYSLRLENEYYIPCFVFYTENTDEKSEDGVIVNKTFVPMYSFAESAE